MTPPEATITALVEAPSLTQLNRTWRVYHARHHKPDALARLDIIEAAVASLVRLGQASEDDGR